MMEEEGVYKCVGSGAVVEIELTNHQSKGHKSAITISYSVDLKPRPKSAGWGYASKRVLKTVSKGRNRLPLQTHYLQSFLLKSRSLQWKL